MNKRNKGITLIALVVTIIVMLILAGIAISLTIGENGIIRKAGEAGTQYNQEAAREKLNLAILDLDAKKIREQGRHLLLEELTEIKEEGIQIQTSNGKVEIFTDDKKGLTYAIAVVDRYKFKVYANLEIELLGKNEEEAPNSIPGYIQDGLVVLYDGKNNTGNGHDNDVTTWKNLAPISEINQQGKYDGILKNFDQTEVSGWKENGLKFDGTNDCVQIGLMNYPNITIEAVVEYEGTHSNGYIASNQEYGGVGLAAFSQKHLAQPHINGSYQALYGSNVIQLNKKYRVSMSYDGNKLILIENDDQVEKSIVGSITAPSNTYMMLGCDPSGTVGDGSYFKGKIYNVRIYNRALSQEEKLLNYEIDKKRFQF